MSRRVRTVPAILTDDPAVLQKLVSQTGKFTGYAQLDIMDGDFVPSRSVSCAQIAAVKPGIKWEAHLMVRRPEDCLEDFKKAGARKIVFHYEAAPDPLEVIRRIRKLGMKAGLAVNPETPVSAIAKLVDKLDSVLFLAVHPGFYGARFIPEVLDKIVEFRRLYPGTETGIDGGVKENNIGEIARTGVNVIYIGSAIFLQPDPAEAYRRLSRLAEAGAS
jgi:ribulose-phosphate 3-epimerase